MANKYHAFGARLQYNDGAGVWRDIAGCRDISGPSMSADTIDVTSHSSPDRFREFRSSLKDPGELTFELIFDPEDLTNQAFLLDLFNSQEVTSFRLIYATENSKTWQMQGLVTNFEPDNPTEGAITASTTIKITGRVLFESSYTKAVGFDDLQTVGNLLVETVGLTAVDNTALTGGSIYLDGVEYDYTELTSPTDTVALADGTVVTLMTIDDVAETISLKVDL